MVEKLTPGRHRPGLTTQQKKHLAALERKNGITAFESGALAAFTFFGTEEEADRAARVLNRGKVKQLAEEVAKGLAERFEEST